MTRVKLLLRYSLLSLCLWLNICAALAQTNRALIVGISRYPEGSGWENIHASNDTRLKQESGLAPTAVFSACLAEETNFEYFDACQSRYYGLLTFAFCKTTLGNKDKPLTVRHFAELLKRKMQILTANKKKRKQTPYLEYTSIQDSFRIGHQQ